MKPLQKAAFGQIELSPQKQRFETHGSRVSARFQSDENWVARRLTGSSEAGSRWLKSLSKRQRLEMDRRLKGPSGHLLSSGGKRIGDFAVSSVWTLPVQIIKPKESNQSTKLFRVKAG